MKRQIFFLIMPAIMSGFFLSCINADDTFGAGLIPNDQKQTVHVYTTDNIPLYTATIDSVPTFSSAYTGIFGSINVSPFNTTNAYSVFRIYPASVNHSYGNNPIFISASLRLIISNKKTSDEDQRNIVQNIHLYKLNKTLSYDSTYYNNSITAADYDNIQINIVGSTYNGEDTLIIPLTETFGKYLMSAEENDMDSLTHFFAKYKGFVLGVDSQPNIGGRLNQTNISDALLFINYKNDEGRDSIFFYYGDNSLVFNIYEHSSSTLSNYVNPPASQDATVYFEGLAGVKPVIDMSAVKDSVIHLMQQYKNADGSQLRANQILINSAKIEVYVNAAPPLYAANYPGTLTLCSRTVTNDKLTYTIIDDAITNSSLFDGTLNKSRQCYSFNVAKYIQQLIKEYGEGNVTSSEQFYMFPTTAITDEYYGYTYNIIDNINYSYGFLYGTGSMSPVRFSVIYTILY